MVQTLTIICLAAFAGLLVPERFARSVARAAFKLSASSTFIPTALSLDATASVYGRWILAALALSWLGDATLLLRRRGAFFAGLGVFLVAHLCFALAFLAWAFSLGWFPVVLIPAIGVGVAVGRWFWLYLEAAYKAPVTA